jgi:hypothetical protein
MEGIIRLFPALLIALVALSAVLAGLRAPRRLGAVAPRREVSRAGASGVAEFERKLRQDVETDRWAGSTERRTWSYASGLPSSSEGRKPERLDQRVGSRSSQQDGEIMGVATLTPEQESKRNRLALCLLSTFLVSVLGSWSCVAADRSIVVPVKLLGHFAVVIVNIDGSDVPLVFDSGNAGSVALIQAVIDRVRAPPIGETSKGMDANWPTAVCSGGFVVTTWIRRLHRLQFLCPSRRLHGLSRK